MPNVGTDVCAFQREIEIEQSLGVNCVQCGAPATVALVHEVSQTIQQVMGALCNGCRDRVYVSVRYAG